MMPEPSEAVDLSSMTKAELLAYAEANGIEGVSSSMLKADIYAVIEAAVAKRKLINAMMNASLKKILNTSEDLAPTARRMPISRFL